MTNETLFSEDLASIPTDMPILAATIAEFKAVSSERQTDHQSDKAKVILNSTAELQANGSSELIGTLFPHYATIWFSGDDASRVKRELAKWVQALKLSPVPKTPEEMLTAIEGKTGRFKVTIKNGFNRFEPVPPNGK